MKTEIITTEQPAMMSSREIAKLTDKKISQVHADIRAMIPALYAMDNGEDIHSYAWGTTKDEMIAFLNHHNIQGIKFNLDDRGYVSEFLLDRRHTEILITGYDVKRRAAVIDRWFKLESGAGRPAVEFDWRNNPAQLRNILISFTEQVEQVTAERDEAIRTKSQISRKREASALGKLSAATRRCRDLEERLGESEKHATITRVEKATGKKGKYNYVLLRRWCRENGISPRDVPDERYGSVKSWPAEAWLAVYGIDLKKLAGGNV